MRSYAMVVQRLLGKATISGSGVTADSYYAISGNNNDAFLQTL
jgi:hypothetical protein